MPKISVSRPVFFIILFYFSDFSAKHISSIFLQIQMEFILLAAYSRQPFLIIGGVYLANDKVGWLAAISLPEVSEQF
jgi:hypothetical protein